MSQNRRRRERLFAEQDGKCFWCGCDMELIVSTDGRLPPHAATTDHLYPRNSFERRYHRASGYVCACFRCNNTRSDAEFLPMMDVLIFGKRANPMTPSEHPQEQAA